LFLAMMPVFPGLLHRYETMVFVLTLLKVVGTVPMELIQVTVFLP
jgi:hypothetical protein